MNRDPELELLLAKLRNPQPSASQMAKWQMAVQSELNNAPILKRRSYKWSAQMAAVLATGFLLGLLSSHQISSSEENNEASATVQYVYSKSQ